MIAPRLASADDGGIETPASIGPSYAWDGGALPLLWAPFAARVWIDEQTSDAVIPEWPVMTLGGVSAIGMISSGDDSSTYHVKGLAESMSSGLLLSSMFDAAVGRRDSSRATQAFAIATYTGLFLRGHVFARYRGNRVLPWWEAATYTGLAFGASALAGERVVRDGQHLTDVAVGSVVGTVTSTLLYFYQESRYKNRLADVARHLSIKPAQSGRGATVGLSFEW